MVEQRSGFTQSEFGKDVESSLAFLTAVYESIALLFRHVTALLAKHGWVEWPPRAKMTETSASLDYPGWWFIFFAAKSFVKGGPEEDVKHPTRVLLVGVELKSEETPFEPLAHAMILHFDRPLERTDWDTNWFRHTIQIGPKELNVNSVQGQTTLLRRLEPKEGAEDWEPLAFVESITFPLAKLDSDEDVRRLIIEPLMTLSEKGFERVAEDGKGIP